MREILFRGKTQDHKWVYWNEYGELVGVGGKKRTRYEYYRGVNSISYSYYVQQLKDSKLLIKDTIGQYTGLTDKNGKKIFEGDIVSITERGITIKGGLVRFEYGYAGGWVVCDPKKQTSRCTLSLRKDVEVIGNVHDNPEWLEVENG